MITSAEHTLVHKEPRKRRAKAASADWREAGTSLRVKLALLAAMLFAVAALALLPRALESEYLLSIQDDPAKLADQALAKRFDATSATREIEQALAANDADLAKSFLELARERSVDVPAELAAKVDAANSAGQQAVSAASSFTRGLITGEPDDLVGLAGTALGDLFVFGDVRDALREGKRFIAGQPVDNLVLGLSAVGIAITAGTYVSLGTAAPARLGLSVVKAARKTGRLGARMGEWVARSLTGIVDASAFRKALAGASITQPAVAVRAAREAVKVEKAGGLMKLATDVGRVQTKAGTQAALDGLKLAEGPREMTRVARLADVKGGKTRAILKFVGRGAIALSIALFDLALWMFGAILTLLGFIVTLKSAVERFELRRIRKKKAKRAIRAYNAHKAAQTAAMTPAAASHRSSAAKQARLPRAPVLAR